MTDNKGFLKTGYKIIKLFNINQINQLLSAVVTKINNFQENKKFTINSISSFHKTDFSESDYRNIIKPSSRYIKINHKKIIKLITNSEISSILKDCWGHNRVKITWVGSAKKGQIKNNLIGFRVARPGKRKKDAASEHIDLYNFDKKSFLTIWIPLLGFTKKYTLKLYPGSHNINHSLSQFKKRHKYISRVFKSSYIKKFKSFRPNLKKGQVIIFHPNLLHGGSENKGNKTRVSLEIRLFNRDRFNLKKTFNKKLVN
jgi:ectoine hydroxylase-related dioxygenase (phytanoyl-CoA dioxygenase family)